MLVLLVLFLCCYLPPSHGQWGYGCKDGNVFFFNNNPNCLAEAGCSFTDTSIWQGGTLPGSGDTVIMQANSTSSVTSINSNSQVEIGCLIITNISLSISQSSKFVVNYDANISNTNVYVTSSSVFGVSFWEYYEGDVDLTDESYVSVGKGSVFYGGNNMEAGNFFLDDTSTLQATDDGQIILSAGNTLLGGAIIAPATASFQSLSVLSTELAPYNFEVECLANISNLYIPSYYNITFPAGLQSEMSYFDDNSTVYISQIATFQLPLNTGDGAAVYFINVGATLELSGNGTIIIANSDVNFLGDTFQGNVILAGAVKIMFQNTSLSALDCTDYNQTRSSASISAVSLTIDSPLPNITINANMTVTGGLTLDGVVTITGDLIVNTGNLTMTGEDAWLQVNGHVRIQSVEGIITSAPVLNLAGCVMTPNTIILGDGATVFVQPDAGFVCLGAHLSSSGIIAVPDGALLYINGTYTTAFGSIIRVENIFSHDTARIQVRDYAYLIDGDVEYSIKSTAKPRKGDQYMVLNSDKSVVGTLGGSTPTNFGDKIKSNLLFKDSSVYIEFEADVKKHKGMPWYGWLLMLFGLGSVGAFVYVSYKRRRQTTGYVEV